MTRPTRVARRVSRAMSQRAGLSRAVANGRIKIPVASRPLGVSLTAASARVGKYMNPNPEYPTAPGSATFISTRASFVAKVEIPTQRLNNQLLGNHKTQFPHLHLPTTSGLLHASTSLLQCQSQHHIPQLPHLIAFQHRSLHTSRRALAPPLFALMAKLIGPLVVKLPGFKLLAAKLLGKGAVASRGGMAFLKILKLTSKMLPWIGRWAAQRERLLHQEAKDLAKKQVLQQKPASLDDVEKIEQTKLIGKDGQAVEVEKRVKLTAVEISEKIKSQKKEDLTQKMEDAKQEASSLRRNAMRVGGAVALLTGFVWAASLEEQDEHFQDGKDFLSPVLDLNYMTKELEKAGLNGQNGQNDPLNTNGQIDSGTNPINTNVPLNNSGKTVLVQREGHPVLRRMRSFVSGGQKRSSDSTELQKGSDLSALAPESSKQAGSSSGFLRSFSHADTTEHLEELTKDFLLTGVKSEGTLDLVHGKRRWRCVSFSCHEEREMGRECGDQLRDQKAGGDAKILEGKIKGGETMEEYNWFKTNDKKGFFQPGFDGREITVPKSMGAPMGVPGHAPYGGWRNFNNNIPQAKAMSDSAADLNDKSNSNTPVNNSISFIPPIPRVNVFPGESIPHSQKKPYNTAFPESSTLPTEIQNTKLSPAQIVQLKNEQNLLLPEKHPLLLRVDSVVQKLVPHLPRTFKEKPNQPVFRTHVIMENTCNAFVLPSGDIFVFAGLLQMCDTEDELAAVLGHEIAHVVLRHSVEKITNSDLWDMSFTTLLLHAMVWTVGPVNFTVMLQAWGAANWMNKLGLTLPFSRLCEEEADFLGLQIAFRAGYRPLAAAELWARIDEMGKKAAAERNKEREEKEKKEREERERQENAKDDTNRQADSQTKSQNQQSAQQAGDESARKAGQEGASGAPQRDALKRYIDDAVAKSKQDVPAEVKKSAKNKKDSETSLGWDSDTADADKSDKSDKSSNETDDSDTTIRNIKQHDVMPEYLSTHPSHASRVEDLTRLALVLEKGRLVGLGPQDVKDPLFGTYSTLISQYGAEERKRKLRDGKFFGYISDVWSSTAESVKAGVSDLGKKIDGIGNVRKDLMKNWVFYSRSGLCDQVLPQVGSASNRWTMQSRGGCVKDEYELERWLEALRRAIAEGRIQDASGN